jgi:hypothetical protein
MGLTIVVVTWWLLIAGAVVPAMPAPVASSPKTGSGPAVGQAARVNLPGLDWLPIPVDRTAFDESQRGYRESDEDAIEHAFTAYEWIRVSHGQAVRVVAVDGEAIEVELLDGGHAGRRGWVKSRQLTTGS